MFLLATDYAFPGKITSWRYHPQIFRAKSTSENAWVAPFRHEFLNIYQRINAAVAECVISCFVLIELVVNNLRVGVTARFCLNRLRTNTETMSSSYYSVERR